MLDGAVWGWSELVGAGWGLVRASWGLVEAAEGWLSRGTEAADTQTHIVRSNRTMMKSATLLRALGPSVQRESGDREELPQSPFNEIHEAPDRLLNFIKRILCSFY